MKWLEKVIGMIKMAFGQDKIKKVKATSPPTQCLFTEKPYLTKLI